MKSNEPAPIVTQGLVKRFEGRIALDDVTVSVERGRVVGLVGRNGSGKSTLLRCLDGTILPTRGSARLFGIESRGLSDRELSRIGVVRQENRFLPWMTARAHFDFTRTFFDRWDAAREARLIDALEIDPAQRIGAMSPGVVQKLAIVTSVCHHPDVLLLDEPAAALDPQGREALLQSLLEILREDEPAIVVASHILHDIERMVDWIVCLDRGRVVRDAALDDLQERYAEWRVTSLNDGLPARFPEPWVLDAAVEGRQAVLVIESPQDHQQLFQARYHAEVESRPIALDRMFRLWTGSKPR